MLENYIDFMSHDGEDGWGSHKSDLVDALE